MDGPLPVDLTYFLLLWDVHTHTGNYIHSCGSMVAHTEVLCAIILYADCSRMPHADKRLILTGICMQMMKPSGKTSLGTSFIDFMYK